MNETMLTLRGFSVVRSGSIDASKKWFVVETMNALLDEAHRFPERLREWEFQKRVLETAIPLYRNTPNFFLHQLTQTKPINRRAVDFIISTLHFIRHGRRQVAVEIWQDLLEIKPTELVTLTESMKNQLMDTERQSELIYRKIEEIVPLWLTCRDGFKDFLITTALIFGSDAHTGA